MGKYKVLFIDWHDTLSTSLFWEHLQDRAHPYHHLFRLLQPLPIEVHKTMFMPWMRGTLTSEEVVHAIAQELQLDKEGASSLLTFYMSTQYIQVRAF